MRAYISGKITGNSNYYMEFEEGKKHVNELGYEAINPAKLENIMPADATHDDYMSVCLPLLSLADAIYMIPGWETSKGSCIEYGYAIAKGLTVLN